MIEGVRVSDYKVWVACPCGDAVSLAAHGVSEHRCACGRLYEYDGERIDVSKPPSDTERFRAMGFLIDPPDHACYPEHDCFENLRLLAIRKLLMEDE